MNKIVLLDGNSIMFRAYYATAYMGTASLMHTSNNLYTNAIYGFVNMITKILAIEDITHIFVAFDKGKKTFRHQTYSDYKGGRKPMPEEFAMQIPYIKKYLDVLNIVHLETFDYEADDLIGSAAKKFKDLVDEVDIISGDKDLLQLVGGNVKVFLTKKGITELEEYNETNFKSLMGIESSQMVDYKSLIGDSSDNLPGISGVGPKTAIKLLDEYKTIENIISNTQNIKGKISSVIESEKDIALRTKYLATIYQDAPLDVELEDLRIKDASYSELRQLFEELEFQSFIKKMSFSNTKIEQPNESKIKTIYHINELETTIDALRNSNKVIVEVELDSSNYHKANILGISFVIGNNGYYLEEKYLDNKELIEVIESDITYYAIDIKKVYVSLKHRNITIKNFGYDVILASYVINPSNAVGDIKSVFEKTAPNNLPYFEDIYGKKTIYQIPLLDTLAKYSIDKCQLVEENKTLCDELLKERDQLKLLYEIEIPLAVILGDVELNGFKVNKEELSSLGEFFTQKMEEVKKKVFASVGHEFNIASPKQLGVVLFEELAIAKGKKNKTGYSTSAEILEELAKIHVVPKLVLEYRKYAKLYSTYVIGLLDEVSKEDDKVHTIFKQSLTQTGRLSSTEPNIQNIPVRTEEGRVIRHVFIPSSIDSYLLSADYSQIELRILASIANCKAMIDTFNNGLDLHADTASKIFMVPLSDVTKDMRRMAKAVNFGIVYGMSDWGLAEELHIPVYEAADFIKKYFEVFKEIKPYLDGCIEDAKKNGYTTTAFNRRRYMPDINSTNNSLRKFSERASMNAPIQGTAADVMKIAMIKVYNALKEANLTSKIVAQVHDELIIDVASNELENVKEIVKDAMEKAVDFKVKLIAEIEYGKTWDLK